MQAFQGRITLAHNYGLQGPGSCVLLVWLLWVLGVVSSGGAGSQELFYHVKRLIGPFKILRLDRGAEQLLSNFPISQICSHTLFPIKVMYVP